MRQWPSFQTRSAHSAWRPSGRSREPERSGGRRSQISTVKTATARLTLLMRSVSKVFGMTVLLVLAACHSRSDRFDDAWEGNCYLYPVTHVPVGWPIPGAPGQIYSDQTNMRHYDYLSSDTPETLSPSDRTASPAIPRLPFPYR